MGKILISDTVETTLNEAVKIQESEPTLEYKRIMKEADERIREDHIRQAKAVRKANNCIAL